MKEFLYLYPIQPYVDALIRRPDVEASCTNLSEIINQRYRVNGYQINWLFFGQIPQPRIPDLEAKVTGIDIRKEDRILVSGVRFETESENYVYPNSSFILNQLPSHLEELVLAGFHRDSCVDRLAAAAYQRGIDTSVDEDLTELFFLAYYSSTPIEIKKRKLEVSEYHKDYVRKARKDRPWLTQI